MAIVFAGAGCTAVLYVCLGYLSRKIDKITKQNEKFELSQKQAQSQ